MANIIGGSIGAGKAILNDYTLGVEDIDGGHRLTITRGSEVQTMDVLDGVDGADGKDGAPGAVQTVNGEAPDENGNVEVQAGVQSDWNQNDETSPAFVKNRPFYTGKPVVTELIPEQTYTLSSSGSVTMYMDESGTYPYSLEVGKEYIVVYNGTTYELTSDNVEGIGVVGDIKPLVTGSNPTMPFAIAAGMGILQIIDYTGNTEVTFKISGSETYIKQIDTKYIPWNDAVGLYPPVLIDKGVESLTDEEKQKYYDLFNKGSLLLVRPGFTTGWYIVISMLYSKTVGLQMTLIGSAGSLYTYYDGSWKSNDITKNGITTTVNDILNERTRWFLLRKTYSSVSVGEAFIAQISWNDSTGKACISKQEKNETGVTTFVNSDILCSGDKEIVLSSSTADSTKKFKITVDDSGTISATEVTE